ncbi:hypothetical protein CC79DRAFT_1311052 [Sarocladium strictum]
MHHDNATYVLHWGYGSRAMPCMNDPASCLYLDSVYIAHDKGMLYAGVMWIIILVVLGAMGVYYRVTSAKASIGDTVVASSPSSSGLSRACRAIGATSRRYLLPDSIRFIFGRTTRFQVVILTLLTIYLTIFSFVGLLYGKWMSPVKNRPGEPEGLYDTRTTLGPWSNRIGIFAYALTPLSVLLSSRESLLSVLTGVPYQHFMFLHRWVGYIIVIQSVLHTIAWTVIMAKLYGPQPRRGNEWIASLYMIWGTAAIILLLLLYVFSLPFVIRRTGYEFFRKSHYVLAMVYCGACIAHWELLHCFLTPAIALWFMDRFMRLGRTYLIHREAIGKNSGFFHPAQAAATLFPNSVEGDIVRLDFQQPSLAWHIGQHYYLCFTDGSIWQSHPFTPLNAPVCVDGVTTHSYIFRAKSGETRKIAEILKSKAQDGGVPTTPVILTGPYGEKLLESHRPDENILCVAGGTGVTYVLPIIMATIRDGIASNRKLELIWFVRHASDVEWIRPEIDALETLANGVIDLTIRVFATRDNETAAVSTSESSSDEREKNEVTAAHKGRLVSVQLASSITTAANSRHPDVRPLVEDFLDKTIAGPTTVIASGPGAMMSELRRVIADNNSGSKVWKGQQRYDVSLQCDDRLEY